MNDYQEKQPDPEHYNCQVKGPDPASIHKKGPDPLDLKQNSCQVKRWILAQPIIGVPDHYQEKQPEPEQRSPDSQP